ncbi:uncharacterized protein LOC113497216 [Trichoplusia ni]|uniref:Uncharacterized protein LOC113497216 n=1 Tax=Trichoplusia ni TaxID=7111 RepID=A0A7E5VVU1_TRINI|nr:uncharacterized protein LOC113497216 [Trichoplusia ni]
MMLEKLNTFSVSDSSESESSSSSSDEEDEGSLDSRDIGPIRLDPNVCPEGCEKEIFDKTYDLRNTRHKHEQNMMEQDKLVELLKRDIEAHNKIKRKLSVQLEQRKNDLREFMLEKQTCMNDVHQVVVLRFDQIRAAAIRGCTGPQGLSQTVVFPEALLHRLRRRVLELQEEIKQQKMRQKINRTHLFRMNIDLRAMEDEARELRAMMRDVLTRKLGKPRKVDRTLDDLLRQMARRHKYSMSYGSMPHIINQLRTWRERHSNLEMKYLQTLNAFSDRLRLAAALQAEVFPQKVAQDPGAIMAGGYVPSQYQRDVMRLLIVREQQKQQIKQLNDEIESLRMKPLSKQKPPTTFASVESEQSDIYLFMVPRSYRQQRIRYFPITPLGSQANMVHDVNITKLLFDCLDAMRVSRDEANELLKDVTELLPDVLAGSSSRYDVTDVIVKKWLLKHGGDPTQYKKQTRAFDAIAALVDRLVRQQVEAMEGSTGSGQILDDLEGALKDVSDEREPLGERLGPALAALLHSAYATDIEDPETLASLVKSLTDDNHPITAASVDRICSFDVIEDIKDCGIDMQEDELKGVVQIAIDSLRAQIIEPEEAAQIDEEVEKAMAIKPEEKRYSQSETHRKSTQSYQGAQYVGESDQRKSIQGSISSAERKSFRRSLQSDVTAAHHTRTTDRKQSRVSIVPREYHSPLASSYGFPIKPGLPKITRSATTASPDTAQAGGILHGRHSQIRTKPSGVQMDVPEEYTPTRADITDEIKRTIMKGSMDHIK